MQPQTKTEFFSLHGYDSNFNLTNHWYRLKNICIQAGACVRLYDEAPIKRSTTIEPEESEEESEESESGESEETESGSTNKTQYKA
ncbi:hypothetical protein PoB_007234300 [Plakobranchus ocellatus]|uniref:Uncharacterized protein n=1 Tax=Plakobranchus ocellatus TaxID=259542 RepID=A0AAV4DNE9_9GAST|nr:hypothetical protein PoB_007234300 [Plakobranchus ocellatus]